MTRDYDLTCRQIDNAAKELRDRIHNLEHALRRIIAIIEEPGIEDNETQKVHDVAIDALEAKGIYAQADAMMEARKK